MFYLNFISLNIRNNVYYKIRKHNLKYTFKKYNNTKSIVSLIPFFKNDKKNDDDRINFILLKRIGRTTVPGKFKISTQNLKKQSKSIAQC